MAAVLFYAACCLIMPGRPVTFHCGRIQELCARAIRAYALSDAMRAMRAIHAIWRQVCVLHAVLPTADYRLPLLYSNQNVEEIEYEG